MRVLLLLPFSLALAQQFHNGLPTTLAFNHYPGRDISPLNSHYQPFYTNMSRYGSRMNGGNGNAGGVQLQYRLLSYSNPGFSIPGGQYCNCPPGADCSSNSGEVAKCHFNFVFIVTSPGEPAHYMETAYFDLDSGGRLPPSGMAKWGIDHVVASTTKPTSLDVFVHHFGYSLKPDGQPSSFDRFHMVDHFSVALDSILPAAGGSVSDPRESTDLSGLLLSTKISLYIGLSCSGSLIGPECDLACNASSINSRVAACRSQSTGYFSICNYNNNQQVENCKRCPWGIRENTYCQDDMGGVLEPETAGVVDPSYRTATIGLAVLSCILLLLVAILAFLLLFRRRASKSEDESLPGHNYHAAATRDSGAAAARPLLQTRYSGGAEGGGAPTPLPRTTPPNLDSAPTKSSLRKPLPVPPAHLGGSNSLNDTLNSSFTSDVLVRPSRSEIV